MTLFLFSPAESVLFGNTAVRESDIFYSGSHLLNINCMLSFDNTLSLWPVIRMLKARVACKIMCGVGVGEDTLAFPNNK